MGVSIDRTIRIAGYRPSTFRDALRSYRCTGNLSGLIDRKSLFSHRRDGAIVYEECIDRGLIDPATRQVTERGLMVARARVSARTPLAKARQVLNDFLARVDQLNSDPQALTRVEEIWLFGSVLREERAVGDIDLAMRTSRNLRFCDEPGAQLRQAEKLIAKFKDAPQNWACPRDQINWLFRRAVFGARRHPLLAGAQEEIDDLVSLAVPCRLIYDRSRGGRVDDPIVPRHPQSAGRSSSLSPPDEMPDLAPAKLRPMDARWVAGFDNRGPVSPREIFRGWTDDCRKLFPRYPESLRIAAEGHNLRGFPWTPRTIEKKRLDGRSAVAIIDAADWRGTCITLHRAIEKEPEGRILRASFSDLLLHRRPKYIDLGTLPDMAAAVSLILAVDAERILRRAIEANALRRITIQISAENLPGDMRIHFAAKIAEMLDRRAVAIEPSGESASVRIELR